MIKYTSSPGRQQQKEAMQWLLANCGAELENGDVRGCYKKITGSLKAGEEGVTGDGVACMTYVLNELCEGKLLENLGSEIPEYFCWHNKRLESVTIPDNIKSIGRYSFTQCERMESITIPDSVESIGDAAFHFCMKLTDLEIPDSVTSIGEEAFRCCHSLKNLKISDNVTNISTTAFAYCIELPEVVLPKNLKTIGASAFMYCGKLEKIEIPASVELIGRSAFYRCDNLTTINYKGTKAQWGAIDKEITRSSYPGTNIVHCIDGDTSIGSMRT